MRTASGPHLEFDAADLSVSWTSFLANLEKIWNRLRTTDVIDTLASTQKTRFQVFVALKDGKYFITRIRAIQGHSSDILTDDQDWVTIHSDIYHLSSNWDPSPMTRPPVGFDGHLSAAFADFPKIAYHATKRKNIASVILNGLFPGGLTTDGSPVKPYVMFSAEPNWVRTDSEGIRENTEIEVVIDLQLAALEGVRLLRTASGCIQTPDWISNRYITFMTAALTSRYGTTVPTACIANDLLLLSKAPLRLSPSCPSATPSSSVDTALGASWMLMRLKCAATLSIGWSWRGEAAIPIS